MEREGQGEGLTPAKKSYSVEDITAALDDMIEGDQYLEGARAQGNGEGGVASEATPPSVGAAEEELDALSQALKGFPKRPKSSQDNEEQGSVDNHYRGTAEIKDSLRRVHNTN